MSDRYTAWIEYIASSDVARTNAALIVVSLLVTYWLVSFLPVPWQGFLRVYYMGAGVVLYVSLLALNLTNTALTPDVALALTVAVSAIGLLLTGFFYVFHRTANRQA